MKKICFFNHFHNGDLFHSKAFIRDIMFNVDTEFYYAHNMNPAVLADMDIQYTPLPNIPQKARYLDLGDTLLINTWIGAYFGGKLKSPDECTLRFNYEMWSHIYGLINQNFYGANMVMDYVNTYVPFINYSMIDTKSVNDYVDVDHAPKILISNGPCHSNQCAYNGDMQSIIHSLAILHTDKTFIATHKFNTNVPNIVFTEDIIDRHSGCDLNEISYLSNYCDVIIGRNSGPYCFSVTDVNVNNPNKTFYAFGERETDSFMHGIETPAKFIFEKFTSLENVYNSIDAIIRGTK